MKAEVVSTLIAPTGCTPIRGVEVVGLLVGIIIVPNPGSARL